MKCDVCGGQLKFYFEKKPETTYDGYLCYKCEKCGLLVFDKYERRHGMTQIGNCPKCGAPIYVPSIWHGITPPPPMYTCGCNSSFTTVVTDNTYKVG